jgi:SAM domain (Sterile alpha motif)
MDLGAWLRSLGLERYERAFRENEIDETVLPEPDARGPEGAWHRRVGHRTVTTASPASVPPEGRAERRQVSERHSAVCWGLQQRKEMSCSPALSRIVPRSLA